MEGVIYIWIYQPFFSVMIVFDFITEISWKTISPVKTLSGLSITVKEMMSLKEVWGVS